MHATGCATLAKLGKMATNTWSESEETSVDKRVLAQFKSENGDLVGAPFDLPVVVSKVNLQALCNVVLANVSIVQIRLLSNN